MFSSAVVAVTPSKIFNSAAVEVTAVPSIDNASVSNVPSISTLPLTSSEPASNSPVNVIFLNEAMSLLASTASTLEATTVPATVPSRRFNSAVVTVAPSSISSSASLRAASPTVTEPPLIAPVVVIDEDPTSMLPNPDVIDPAFRAPTVVTFAKVSRLVSI